MCIQTTLQKATNYLKSPGLFCLAVKCRCTASRVPDECPPQVMSLYMACTALNPQHRPTAFELMDTLVKCIAAGQNS